MNEYVSRHTEDFALALKEARERLFEGEAEAVAYLLDEDPKDVKRVSASRD